MAGMLRSEGFKTLQTTATSARNGKFKKEPAMKKPVLFIIPTVFLFITGCSTTVPCTPKQHPEKYVVQTLWIEIPADQVKQSQPQQFSHDEIEYLLKNPKAVLTDSLVVYVAVGELAVNDQTKKIPAHETYEVKTNRNGVVEVVYDGTARVGRYAEITIQKAESNYAICALNLYDKSLIGMQKFEVARASGTAPPVIAAMPIFKKRSIETTCVLFFETWMSGGGGIMQTNNGLPVLNLLAYRLIPPKKANYKPTKPPTS